MPSVASGCSVVIRSLPADRMELMATPASTTVIRDAPTRSARNRISSDAPSAPRNAAMGSSAMAVGKKQASKSVQKPAPAFTPMMFGPASGLPSTP